jgi:hypothetical protein
MTSNKQQMQRLLDARGLPGVVVYNRAGGEWAVDIAGRHVMWLGKSSTALEKLRVELANFDGFKAKVDQFAAAIPEIAAEVALKNHGYVVFGVGSLTPRARLLAHVVLNNLEEIKALRAENECLRAERGDR